MTEGAFPGKMGDYLFLQRLQEVFVKLGVIDIGKKVFFGDFAGWAGENGANKPLFVGD